MQPTPATPDDVKESTESVLDRIDSHEFLENLRDLGAQAYERELNRFYEHLKSIKTDRESANNLSVKMSDSATMLSMVPQVAHEARFFEIHNHLNTLRADGVAESSLDAYQEALDAVFEDLDPEDLARSCEEELLPQSNAILEILTNTGRILKDLSIQIRDPDLRLDSEMLSKFDLIHSETSQYIQDAVDLNVDSGRRRAWVIVVVSSVRAEAAAAKTLVDRAYDDAEAAIRKHAREVSDRSIDDPTLRKVLQNAIEAAQHKSKRPR